MKKLALVVALALGWCGIAEAQFYSKFGPANGVMKGSTTTPQTTSAVSTDVSTLFCSSSITNFLRADGTCAVPAGTTTGANPTATVSGTAVNGTATTFMRSDAAPPLNLGAALTWTALETFNGGIAGSTFTAHGVLIGEGASAVTPVVMGADTVLRGTASADPVATAVNNCGSSTQALSYSTSTHTFGCQTISGSGGTVTSLTAGTAIALSPSTITSTGSISLDTTASPSITGFWTFTSGASPAITINHNTGVLDDILVTGSAIGDIQTQVKNTNTAGSASYKLVDGNTTPTSFTICGSTCNAAPLATGGPTGEQVAITTTSAIPFMVSNAGIARFVIAAGTSITGYGPVAGALTDMTPDHGSFTGTLTGMTTVTTGTINWTRMGNLVTLYDVGAITGTSNTTAMTLTGLPAAITPTIVQQKVPCSGIEDNGGGDKAGLCFVLASGPQVAFSLLSGTSYTGAFTATGTKGLNGGMSITYAIN